MKAIICKNLKKKSDDGVIAAVIEKLRGFGIDALQKDQADSDCDVIITVGGDGAILYHGKTAARLGKPLLGINTGRLGFMTSLETGELDKLEALKRGGYVLSSRMMLDIEVGGKSLLALNDAVFHREHSAKLPEFAVVSNHHTVSEIRADGLILSTPTGSTAYALSAGGPIIEPWLDCVELTQLCAHSLFGRPVIFSAEQPLTVKYKASPDDSGVSVCVDGENAGRLAVGEEAVIRKSNLRLKLVDINGDSFHKAVRNKLMKPL